MPFDCLSLCFTSFSLFLFFSRLFHTTFKILLKIFRLILSAYIEDLEKKVYFSSFVKLYLLRAYSENFLWGDLCIDSERICVRPFSCASRNFYVMTSHVCDRAKDEVFISLFWREKLSKFSWKNISILVAIY